MQAVRLFNECFALKYDLRVDVFRVADDVVYQCGPIETDICCYLVYNKNHVFPVLPQALQQMRIDMNKGGQYCDDIHQLLESSKKEEFILDSPWKLLQENLAGPASLK